ncbi:MAG TPA: NAD(P)/FAD-dependent oxidoreductase, partial [Longimicrobiaceae bacterium]|nr:NAD(P)/FAD-dependent oxidoreductase [Longimicrobiaceae bacterium]
MDPLDLAIVGGGATGLAAAVQAAAEGLRTTVLERGPLGGRLRGLARVQTVPGHPVGLSGSELVERSAEQARRFGAEVRTGADVGALRVEGDLRVLELADGGTVATRAVVVASGAGLPELPVPGLRELVGSGVHFGAPAEVPEALCGRDVFVAAELDVAAEAGLRLSRRCRSVTLLPPDRRVSPRPSPELAGRLRGTLNVRIVPNAEVLEVAGVESLETVTLRHRATGRTSVWTATALFLLGLETPRTAWLSGVVVLDGRGFVATGPEARHRAGEAPEWPLPRSPFPLEASAPGVFAAGGARRGAAWCAGCSTGEGIASAR